MTNAFLITDDDTADGFSDFYIKELIQSLKDGTYKANPVRREYIPKKNGKLRPLGIPSFRDKLLQEVVRMILEAIYEPVFDSHSHGDVYKRQVPPHPGLFKFPCVGRDRANPLLPTALSGS